MQEAATPATKPTPTLRHPDRWRLKISGPLPIADNDRIAQVAQDMGLQAFRVRAEEAKPESMAYVQIQLFAATTSQDQPKKAAWHHAGCAIIADTPETIRQDLQNLMISIEAQVAQQLAIQNPPLRLEGGWEFDSSEKAYAAAIEETAPCEPAAACTHL